MLTCSKAKPWPLIELATKDVRINKKTKTASFVLKCLLNSENVYVGNTGITCRMAVEVPALSDDVMHIVKTSGSIASVLAWTNKKSKVAIKLLLATVPCKQKIKKNLTCLKLRVRGYSDHKYSILEKRLEYEIYDIDSDSTYYGNQAMITRVAKIRTMCIRLHLPKDIANMVMIYYKFSIA